MLTINSISEVIIGIDITNITSFPASKIFDAIAEFPLSEHRFALNSVIYPTPTIFIKIVKSLESRFVICIIYSNRPKACCKRSIM